MASVASVCELQDKVHCGRQWPGCVTQLCTLDLVGLVLTQQMTKSDSCLDLGLKWKFSSPSNNILTFSEN